MNFNGGGFILSGIKYIKKTVRGKQYIVESKAAVPKKNTAAKQSTSVVPPKKKAAQQPRARVKKSADAMREHFAKQDKAPKAGILAADMRARFVKE